MGTTKTLYDEEAQRKYQEALDRVAASLDARKNRLFDPTLLAFAEGMLAPTKTGSFFEGLGNAATKMRGVESEQLKEERELAQMQLELAKQGMQLERQRQMSQAYANVLNPPVPPSGGSPSAPPRVGGAPAGAPTAAPAGGAAARPEGFQIAPPRPLSMTKEQFLRNAQMEGKPLGQALKDWDEYSRKGLEIKESGRFDLETGRFFPTPKAELVNIPIRGYSGNYPVSPEDAMRLADLERAGNAEAYNALAARIVKGPAGTGGIASIEEQEREKAKSKILTEKAATTEAEQRAELLARGNAATEKISTANQIFKLASSPAASRMFGILNNPSWSAQLAKVLSNTVSVGGFTVGIPEVQNILRNLNLSPEEIAKYQYATMLLANTQLEASQLGKGQGSVSDAERRLFAAMGMSSEDTPGSLMMKSKAVMYRAQFDRQVARLWEDSQDKYKSLSQFKRSDEYVDALANYEEKLGQLLSESPMPAPAKRQQSASPGQSTPPPSSRFKIERP